MKKIPPPKYGLSNKKYEFCNLKNYGDNVFVETENFHGVRDAAYKYAKYNGFSVATRTEPGGLRVYHAGSAADVVS